MKIYSFKHYFTILVSFVISIHFTFGQQNSLKPYQEKFLKANKALEKGDREKARKYFIESLNTCTVKDSIDIIKTNIANCNIAQELHVKSKLAFLIGENEIGAINLNKLLTVTPNSKPAKKRLSLFWKSKVKEALRNNSFESATANVEKILKYDSSFTKKERQVFLKNIQQRQKKYVTKLIKFYSLDEQRKDSVSVEKLVHDSLKRSQEKYIKKDSSISIKPSNHFFHIGFVQGFNYSMPQFEVDYLPFDRIYPQYGKSSGIKITLGRVSSKISFSAEYRRSSSFFNTYINNLDRKITVEDFSFETNDFPIYANYQIPLRQYHKGLVLISLGGILHKASSFHYKNYVEDKTLDNVVSLNNTWRSVMLGASLQRNLFKNVNVEFSISYQRGLDGFINLDLINALYIRGYNSSPALKPITSSKINTLTTGISILF